MQKDQVVFSLVKKDCEMKGFTTESRLVKMTSLLNIHPEIYQKAMESLITDRKVGKKGRTFFLV